MPSGQPNNYTAGNCTWYVKDQLSWVPNGWGNAAEWWSRASAAGFSTCSGALQGSVAVWGPGIDPPQGFGHVAVVTSVQPDGSFVVSEMNWQGLGKVDSRTVKDRSNLLGFIYPPGQKCGSGTSSSTTTGGSGGDPFGISTALQGASDQLISSAQIGGGALLIAFGLVTAAVLWIGPEKIMSTIKP